MRGRMLKKPLEFDGDDAREMMLKKPLEIVGKDAREKMFMKPFGRESTLEGILWKAWNTKVEEVRSWVMLRKYYGMEWVW